MNRNKELNLRAGQLKEDKIREYSRKTYTSKNGVSGLGTSLILIGGFVFIKWLFDRLSQVEWLSGIKWIYFKFVDLPFHLFFISTLFILLFFIIITTLGRAKNHTKTALLVVFCLITIWFLAGLTYGFLEDFKNLGFFLYVKEWLNNFLKSFFFLSENRNDLSFINKAMGFLLNIFVFYFFLALFSQFFFFILRRVNFYNLFLNERNFLEIASKCFSLYLFFYLLFSIAGFFYILY